MAAPRRRPVLPRFVALSALAAGVYRFGHRGDTFAVSGQWESDLDGAKDVATGDLEPALRGLEPQVKFPEVTFGDGNLNVGVADGHLRGTYSTKLGDSDVQVAVDDERAWRATLQGEGRSLKARGQGADPSTIFWEATQSGHIEDLGDTEVQFNSDKEYTLSLSRDELLDVGGVNIGARASATHKGVAARLAARRALAGGAEASYSVQNPEGVYDLGRLRHELGLRAALAGGEATAAFEGDAAVQAYRAAYRRALAGGEARLALAREVDEDAVNHYNLSYSRGLGKRLPLDSNFQVGVDEDGAYGGLAASGALGRGLAAEYQAQGRVRFDEDRETSFEQALKLSNKLGYAQLAHRAGEAPRVKVGYGFEA